MRSGKTFNGETFFPLPDETLEICDTEDGVVEKYKTFDCMRISERKDLGGIITPFIQDFSGSYYIPRTDGADTAINGLFQVYTNVYEEKGYVLYKNTHIMMIYYKSNYIIGESCRYGERMFSGYAESINVEALRINRIQRLGKYWRLTICVILHGLTDTGIVYVDLLFSEEKFIGVLKVSSPVSCIEDEFAVEKALRARVLL